MSIDYGDKRTGIALSDPMHTISYPLCVIKQTNEENLIVAVGGDATNTIAYSKGFNSFGVFLELFGNESTDISLINFDSGITYQLDNNNQFDLSFARGLNNDLFYFSIGYSIDIN